ncbi:MAG: HEAT repeat domain-containing protein, partial [Planctomycetota bacterium]
SWLVRKKVAEILGILKYNLPEVLQILRKLLKDPQIEVKYEAAWSLQKLGYSDGRFLAAKDLDSPRNRLRAIVLLRGIFRRSFGLRQDTTKEELVIIAKRWKRFLRNKGYLSKKTK